MSVRVQGVINRASVSRFITPWTRTLIFRWLRSRDLTRRSDFWETACLTGKRELRNSSSVRPRLCQKEIDPVGTRQFGLVAEDVEKLNPDLVVHDERGQVNSVRYDQVNAMLLNEFLKEHRKVQEQEALIAS